MDKRRVFDPEKSRKMWMVAGCVALLMGNGKLSADTVELQNGTNGYTGTSDTYLVMNTDKAQGAKDLLVVEGYHCPSCIDQRVLIKFDLASIPKGSTITNATLSLYDVDQPRPGASTINVYLVSQPWTEDTATWVKATATTKWNKAGGDFTATAITSYQYSSTVQTWNTVDLTSVVQGFVNKPETNYGVMLFMEPIMHTVRYTSANSSDQQHRPKLTITKSSTAVAPISTNVKKGFSFEQLGKGKIGVVGPSLGNYTVVVHDLAGRILDRQDLSGRTIIDLAKFSTGAYVLRIVKGTAVVSEWVVPAGQF